ncbi:MAG: DUF2357 domain-containing protein [Candidatus Coproplasma sp.]
MDKQFLSEFISKINCDEESFSRFFSALRGGDNSVFHNIVSQSVELDDTWIIMIENGLTPIEQIVHRPRKFIAENSLLLDIEKVRRTNTKTVRHLTTHSQYVQNYDKDTGEIRPKKLLTVEMEEDIAIYENRFVCALINRLTRFVEQRNHELNGQYESFEQTNVKIQSKFNYGESEFNCNIELKVNEPPTDTEKDKRNRELFDRVQNIRRRLSLLQTTEFMKILNKAKPVRPPIQKTNLLNKNVDYNACYKLWLFLSSYDSLGYSIIAKDKFLPVDGDYYDDLTVLTSLSLQSLITDKILKRETYDSIEFNEPQEKDFKLVKSFTYKPDFVDSVQQSDSETINEYYFRKMKDELILTCEEGDIPVEKRLNVNFVKFFRSISRINDAMFNELIEEQVEASVPETQNKKKVLSVKERKKEQLRRQNELIRRRKLFLKLKWEELEKAQRMCERAEAKYNKLKADYDKDLLDAKSKRVTKVKIKTKKDK